MVARAKDGRWCRGNLFTEQEMSVSTAPDEPSSSHFSVQQPENRGPRRNVTGFYAWMPNTRYRVWPLSRDGSEKGRENVGFIIDTAKRL
jgi:hypothetical protein